MKFFRMGTVIILFCLTALLAMNVSASDVNDMNIWIDRAKYDVRGGTATVKVDIQAYIPYGAAEGTLTYDPDILTLNEVKYDKQALELSYHEDENERGIIRICCYGKFDMEYPENICFVFSADTSYTDFSRFSLDNFVLCDSDNNTMNLTTNMPVELYFSKGSEAKNPLSEYYDSYREKSSSFSIPTEADDSNTISMAPKTNSKDESSKLFFHEENSGCNRDAIVYSILAVLIVGALIYRFIREAKAGR